MNFFLKKMVPLLEWVPLPSSINLFWNFGSLLLMGLLFQIFTGVLLTLSYDNHLPNVFSSLLVMVQDSPSGWILRALHSNNASVMFVFIYFHLARGLYYQSFMKSVLVWFSGFLIFSFLMISAFLGYILPWGQMSFWGATVITNFLSVVPGGTMGLMILWGNMSIEGELLLRFFSLHYLAPLVMIGFVLLHVEALHFKGSSNPLSLCTHSDKLPISPYFSMKDLEIISLSSCVLLSISFTNPFLLGDPENFIEANPLKTPNMIMPEWYFLAPYSILRGCPNKLGGVVLMVMAILFFLSPMLSLPFGKLSLNSGFLFKSGVTAILLSYSLLSVQGTQAITPPSILFSQVLTFAYFMAWSFINLKNKTIMSI